MGWRVTVIGCGEPGAGDSALGLLAIEQVRDSLEKRPGVRVVPATPLDDVDSLVEEADAIVLVDSVSSEGKREVGELVRFQIGGRQVPPEIEAGLSHHGIRLAETVTKASEDGRVARIVFLGLEVGGSHGPDLSNEIHQALPGLGVLIEGEVSRLCSDRQ